jgi:hypothetical protein
MYLAKPKERVSQLVPSSRCFLDHTGDNPTIYQYSRGQVEIRGSLHKENTGFWKPLFPESRKVKKNVGNHLPIELNGFNHFSGVFSRGAMVCHGLPESWSLVGLCFGWVLRGHHVLFKAPFAKFPTFKVGPHNTFFDQPGHRDARNADCSVQSPFGYQVHGGWPAMYCNQKFKPTATFNSGVMSESGVNIPVKFLQ